MALQAKQPNKTVRRIWQVLGIVVVAWIVSGWYGQLVSGAMPWRVMLGILAIGVAIVVAGSMNDRHNQARGPLDRDPSAHTPSHKR